MQQWLIILICSMIYHPDARKGGKQVSCVGKVWKTCSSLQVVCLAVRRIIKSLISSINTGFFLLLVDLYLNIVLNWFVSVNSLSFQLVHSIPCQSKQNSIAIKLHAIPTGMSAHAFRIHSCLSNGGVSLKPWLACFSFYFCSHGSHRPCPRRLPSS